MNCRCWSPLRPAPCGLRLFRNGPGREGAGKSGTRPALVVIYIQVFVVVLVGCGLPAAWHGELRKEELLRGCLFLLEVETVGVLGPWTTQVVDLILVPLAFRASLLLPVLLAAATPLLWLRRILLVEGESFCSPVEAERGLGGVRGELGGGYGVFDRSIPHLVASLQHNLRFMRLRNYNLSKSSSASHIHFSKQTHPFLAHAWQSYRISRRSIEESAGLVLARLKRSIKVRKRK